MTDIAKLADWLIDFANKGGALSASALMFLWAIAASFLLYKRLKWENSEQIKRLEAWLAASQAEEHQTMAIGKIAEGLKVVSEGQVATANQVAIVVALIKDRRNVV